MTNPSPAQLKAAFIKLADKYRDENALDDANEAAGYDVLRDEYIAECEHAEGISYWSEFTRPSDILEDYLAYNCWTN